MRLGQDHGPLRALKTAVTNTQGCIDKGVAPREARGEEGKQPRMHLLGQGKMPSQVTAAMDEKWEKAGFGRTRPKSFSMKIQLVLTHLEFPLHFTSPEIRALG